MYEGWPETLLESEKNFYRRFEPRLWMRAAFQFREAAKTPKVRLTDLKENHAFLSEDEVQDLQSNFEGTRKLILRQFRYQSAETLLLLIISGQKSFPYMRAASKIRFGELTDHFKSIAGGAIPSGFEVSINGKPLAFSDWIFAKITGQIGEPLDETIPRFISQEARLAAGRGAINAIKHARASVDIGENELRMIADTENEEQTIFEGPTISYDHWEEKKVGGKIERSHLTSFESCDPVQDERAIFVGSIIMTAIQKIRLSLLAGEKSTTNIKLPLDINLDSSFFRLNSGIRENPS